MIPPDAPAPLAHGGDLDEARKLFPAAPEPFLDLSTAINPHPYPIPALAPQDFARLPSPADLARLKACAASAYGAPSADCVVPAPGSQIIVSLAAGLAPPGRAAVLGPTYGEHARAAANAGRDVMTVSALAPLGDAALAIIVNPNNPDGRLFAKDDLLGVAARQRAQGGLLIVDEAFMDVGPRAASLADVGSGNIIVLRSFGKFFGLAGLRLSFALCAAPLAARLAAALGPWPVSGAAIAIGERALQDKAWIETTRASLSKDAQRLEHMLTGACLEIVGGTDLFRLARSPDAKDIFARLGRAGLYVRRFTEEPSWLRFGLPGGEEEWQRLEAALGG